MDKQGRLTSINEVKLGYFYVFKKGKECSYDNPWLCKKIDLNEKSIIFEDTNLVKLKYFFHPNRLLQVSP